MAGPWENYAPTNAQPEGPWTNYQPKQATPQNPMQQMGVLPFSVSEDGQDFQFDSNAGLLGIVKRAVTLPGDVAIGNVDPHSQEGISRAAELGALISPASPAIRAGEMPALFGGRMVQDRAAVPTADELRTAGREGYATARDTGVEYAPHSVNNLATKISGSLENDGLLSELAPATHSILRKLAEEQPAGAVAPVQGLIAARQALSRAARQIDPVTRGPTQDAAAASRAVRSIDAFLESPPSGSVLAGPADTAAAALRDANANYGAAVRSDRLTDKADISELRAAAANSGKNIGNGLRQQAASILANPKLSAGYSAEEVAALEEIVRGTPTRNAIRTVSNLLGGGGGLGAMLTGAAGAAAGTGAHPGVVGAGLGAVALPAIGMVAKQTENALTRGAVERAGDVIRQRSPLYQDRVTNAPFQLQTPTTPQAGARGVLVDMLGANDPADAGAKFINAPGQNKEYVKDLMTMDPAERADFSKGFARNLEICIANADDKRGTVNKIFSNPQARQRVEMALGTEGARKFEGEMRRKYTVGKII